MRKYKSCKLEYFRVNLSEFILNNLDEVIPSICRMVSKSIEMDCNLEDLEYEENMKKLTALKEIIQVIIDDSKSEFIQFCIDIQRELEKENDEKIQK